MVKSVRVEPPSQAKGPWFDTHPRQADSDERLRVTSAKLKCSIVSIQKQRNIMISNEFGIGAQICVVPLFLRKFMWFSSCGFLLVPIVNANSKIVIV